MLVVAVHLYASYTPPHLLNVVVPVPVQLLYARKLGPEQLALGGEGVEAAGGRTLTDRTGSGAGGARDRAGAEACPASDLYEGLLDAAVGGLYERRGGRWSGLVLTLRGEGTAGSVWVDVRGVRRGLMQDDDDAEEAGIDIDKRPARSTSRACFLRAHFFFLRSLWRVFESGTYA